jgi:hypothetical protein
MRRWRLLMPPNLKITAKSPDFDAFLDTLAKSRLFTAAAIALA